MQPGTTVPTDDSAAGLDEVQRRLTENESQPTEVSGYINQLSIQHRWQRRLQLLNDRKKKLCVEMAMRG